MVVYGTGLLIPGTHTITSSGAALSTATNYHACVTWSASGVTLYQNGSSVGTDATAPSLTASTMYLGSNASSANQLGGWLDEILFWSAALTTAQVAALAASSGPAMVGTTTKYYLPFDDDLRGDGGRNAIWGGAGDDSLAGGGGPDMLQGGPGDDAILGGGGGDLLRGGPGSDAVSGQGQSDRVYGDAGPDVLRGGAGADLLFGDDRDVSLDGGDGEDVCRVGDAAPAAC